MPRLASTQRDPGLAKGIDHEPDVGQRRTRAVAAGSSLDHKQVVDKAGPADSRYPALDGGPGGQSGPNRHAPDGECHQPVAARAGPKLGDGVRIPGSVRSSQPTTPRMYGVAEAVPGTHGSRPDRTESGRGPSLPPLRAQGSGIGPRDRIGVGWPRARRSTKGTRWFPGIREMMVRVDHLTDPGG